MGGALVSVLAPLFRARPPGAAVSAPWRSPQQLRAYLDSLETKQGRTVRPMEHACFRGPEIRYNMVGERRVHHWGAPWIAMRILSAERSKSPMARNNEHGTKRKGPCCGIVAFPECSQLWEKATSLVNAVVHWPGLSDFPLRVQSAFRLQSDIGGWRQGPRSKRCNPARRRKRGPFRRG